VKNSRGKILEKNEEKIGVEKTWINDLEEVKSMEKCHCGKKHEKFRWKNIKYLVVPSSFTSCGYKYPSAIKHPQKSESLNSSPKS